MSGSFWHSEGAPLPGEGLQSTGAFFRYGVSGPEYLPPLSSPNEWKPLAGVAKRWAGLSKYMPRGPMTDKQALAMLTADFERCRNRVIRKAFA